MFVGHVEETFYISGRGLVVVLDVTYEQLTGDLQLKIGDSIELRDAKGAALLTSVRGIEHSDPWTPKRLFAFLLPTGVERSSVQIGEEVHKLA